MAASMAVASIVAIATTGLANADNKDEQLVVINGRYNQDRFEDIFPANQVLFPIKQKVNGDLYEFYLENPKPLETSEILPLIQSMGTDVTVRAVNTSDSVYYLSIPSQSTKIYVPILSERAVNVDIDKIPAGKSVTYFVEDKDGNKVAGGYIINGELEKPAFYSASSQQHADWSRRIQTLITANEYKPPYFPPKPEPKYYKPAPKKQTVRGYW